MKLACLITAYDQPDHLRRLVAALHDGNVHFHVHVDANVEIEPFERALAGLENVHFTQRRFAVQWMGFSQVRSILQLLTEASTVGFDYCVLLSGSDYPIKSNDYIRSFYERATQEFITFWRLEDRPSWIHKVQYFYPIDLVPIRGYSKGTERSYLRRLFWGRFHKFRRFMPRRKLPFGMTPYGGSDWWSLSGDCVSYVLRFVADHPAYSRFYRFTHCPSEMFFHTIIMNSPWAQRARMYAEYETWSARTPPAQKLREQSMLPEEQFNLRYIDWSGERSGAREAPAVLDERDWTPLLQSPALFARKFDSVRSAALLDRLDQARLGGALT
jgi:hypothetical protein